MHSWWEDAPLKVSSILGDHCRLE